MTAVVLLATSLGATGSTSAQPILGGFVEVVQAVRIEKNPAFNSSAFEHPHPRSEARMQLTLRQSTDLASFFVRGDVVSDWVGYSSEETEVDLREAYVGLTPTSWLQLKAGRQVATSGVGDLIFCNDLYAKDWNAFFTGLDDAYLKYPQALLRVTMQHQSVTYDAAISPRSVADKLPDHERISFNEYPSWGSSKHPQWFQRLSMSVGGFEGAIYTYWGHWPTPQGLKPPQPFFISYHPELASVGASARFPLESYLLTFEIADYISLDDTDGRDPLVANSQVRGLIGLERSFGNDLTIAAQYYAEYMRHYDAYRSTSATFLPTSDELRSLATVRLTKLLWHQTVQISCFGFWGISDEDWHLRPSFSYDISDGIKLTVGGSLLDGASSTTMFGQFRENSNVFGRLRYSF